MRVLLIKMSSLGDVIHMLPAIMDAKQALPELQLHWVVEEDFAALVEGHPAVERVIPIALRRWRRKLFKRQNRDQWRQFKNQLNQHGSYDKVIDAQGLIKSALVTRLVSANSKVGFDRRSAREAVASYFYDKKIPVTKNIHAVERLRVLMAHALDYPLPQNLGRYGLEVSPWISSPQRKIFFAHGTTWDTKFWPDQYWIDLARLCQQQGFEVILPWYTEQELARAKKIDNACSSSRLLPKMGLMDLLEEMKQSDAVVAVDTGLGHLAAAYGIAGISLYGPTDSNRTGTYGKQQLHLSGQYPCSPCLKRKCQFEQTGEKVYPPCFESVTPHMVRDRLLELLG